MDDLFVAAGLQRDLIDDITTVLKDIVTTKADGTETTGFTGYAQYLPVLRNDDEEPDKFFPYFIVRLVGCEKEKELGIDYITVNVIIGVHDDKAENNGHYSVLNAITRIEQRYCQEPTLGRKKAFRCDDTAIEWALQDEDTYPYFFGLISLKFWAPRTMRLGVPHGKYIESL